VKDNGSHRFLGVAIMALAIAVGLLAVRSFFDERVPSARPPATDLPTPTATRSANAPRLDAQVLARAKAATVFVQVRNESYLTGKTAEESSGTGFFISSDGHVATSWHVVSATKSVAQVTVPLQPREIQVILRSGKRDQRVLPARLLAIDAAADLAVLKVEATGCTALPLGSAEKLIETSPLWVLGFPLGRMFSVLQRGPELSVNGGTVSSLRHDDLGRLQKLQFDAVVIPGNSGGPVITPRGKVVGVANIALGTSRVNFAIPVENLRALLKQCPTEKRVGAACRLRIDSRPRGARIYLDSKSIGKTPLEIETGGGYRRLVISAPGHRSWTRRLSLYDGKQITAAEATLEPLRAIRLVARALPLAAVSGGKAMKRGAEIFSEDFTDVGAADHWKQDTGGSDRQRTWYVEKGALHQLSGDGVLHAVFADRQKLSDYSFRARVRIRKNQSDGRAGLIFRSSADGFALFRLHRGSNKVQLAYHVNQPFGWRVLDERALNFKVQGDHWYRMEVQALGDQVVCLLDDRVVLEATVQRKAAGKVGFYSVDSRAAFDDASVSRVSAPGRAPGKAPVLRGFWFSDNFEADSGYWQAFAAGKPAAPWPQVPSACLQLDRQASQATNMLSCYDIRDMMANCLVSCRAGAVGLVFRGGEQGHYLFEVQPGKSIARLLLVAGGKRQVLGSASGQAVKQALGLLARNSTMRTPRPDPSAALLADLISLSVVVQRDRLRAAINGRLLIDVKNRTLSSGQVGLYTNKTRAVFHSLNVTSPMAGQ
jgi:S1-C subfamily serine protease